MTDQFLDDVQGRPRFCAQAHERVPQAVESDPNDRPAPVTLSDFLIRLKAAALKERLDLQREITGVFGMEGLLFREQVTCLRFPLQVAQERG